jgi:hypothetical protein
MMRPTAPAEGSPPPRRRGQAPAPVRLSRRSRPRCFTQVSAGPWAHTCALRSDGVVECWGDDTEEQAPGTRTALSGTFTQLSAGSSHTCALRGDGVVECWGDSGDGQAPPTRTAQGPTIVTLLPAASFRATPTSVVAGDPFTLALDSAHIPGLPVPVPFTYAFDCGDGSGYGPFGASHTVICPTSAAGSRTVRGTVRDHHGDAREYTRNVPVSAPGGAPTAPTALAATAATPAQVDLTWSDNSDHETHFQLQRRIRNADGTWGSYALVASPPAAATGYSDTGLSAGTRYRYRVRACTGTACSTWSNVQTVTTPQ